MQAKTNTCIYPRGPRHENVWIVYYHNLDDFKVVDLAAKEPIKMSACFNCGQVGHQSKACTAPRNGGAAGGASRAPRGGNCYNCEQPGHLARDCPTQSERAPRSKDPAHDHYQLQAKQDALQGVEGLGAIPADDNAGKMFIGGLSWETSLEGLRNYFSKFGTIIDCMIMKDRASGRSRGFGFITFSDPRNCDDVMQNGPHTLDQRTIDPKLTVPRGSGSDGRAPGGVMQQQSSSAPAEKTCKVFVGKFF